MPKQSRAVGVLENPPADPADAHALRALQAGTATADQQQRALRWILVNACDTAGQPYWPSDRDTAFALGRLFVGKQIGRLLTCDISTLRGPEHVRPDRNR